MNYLDDQLSSIGEVQEMVSAILGSQLTETSDTAFLVYDFRKLNDRLDETRSSFPSSWQHSAAIKANPLGKVLSNIIDKKFILEAASFEEVMLGVKAGANHIVWDSPVKTEAELQLALQLGINLTINANSLSELKWLNKSVSRDLHHIQIGLRINPQLAMSSMQSMSVAGKYSKFGEPIENANAILDYWKSSDRTLGIHVHASSQNLELTETVNAVEKVYKLAETVGWQHISYIDIGGGFPVNYGQLAVPSIKKYARLLEDKCPFLFSNKLTVLTEFGRFYHANSGFTVSQIQEVKQTEKHQIVVQHVGADLFLRECYEPGKWPHRMAIIDRNSNLKTGDLKGTDVAGPLCFGGDYIAKCVDLPKASKDDKLIILDTGANSLALWSKHCSRSVPKVFGIMPDGNVAIIKARESIEKSIDFWF